MDASSDEAVEFLSDGADVLEGLRLGGIGVWRWKVETPALEWTENLEAVHDLAAGSFDGTLASFQRDIHPDDAAAVWRNIEASLVSGQPYRAVYRTRPREGRPPLWIETTGGLVTDPDGTRYLTGVCLDVTDRVRNELELKRRLRQQQAVERCGSDALAETEFQATLQHVAETAADVLDVPIAAVLRYCNNANELLLTAGVGWQEGVVGGTRVAAGQQSQAGFTLLSAAPVVLEDLASETRFDSALLRRHGARSGISVAIPGTETRPFGVLGVHSRERRRFDQADTDFLVSLANIIANSARHHAGEAQRSLLVREMAHRAGNLLQLVSTIASQTFGDGSNLAAARRSFNQRLGSLSRANHLVARGGWSSTRFVTLLEETLQPFRERLELQGHDILLPAELCFDLGLILHELATNSAKYGALGAEAGEIRLRWTLTGAGQRPRHATAGDLQRNDPEPYFSDINGNKPVAAGADGNDVFLFTWDDPQSSPESTSAGNGFGSRLLRALIEQKWGGSIEVDTSAGYRFTCEMPIAR